MLPQAFGELVKDNLRVEKSVDAAVEGADVLMILRVQRERQRMLSSFNARVRGALWIAARTLKARRAGCDCDASGAD
jgi:aspartate carbamoyltransferase catalytic subunit